MSRRAGWWAAIGVGCLAVAACGPSVAPTSAPTAVAPVAGGAGPTEGAHGSKAESSPAAALPAGPSEGVALRDAAPDGAEAWGAIEPEEAGFDRGALGRIVETATSTESSSLLVLKDGKVVVERYFGQARRPIETMSATKSVVSLAIGLLLDERKIRSLDEPLSTWYPEYAAGKKAKITLRHVLTHSTGLAHGMGAGAMNKEKDRLKYARSREVVAEPGTVFSYNNEATQLLSGIIEKAAGVPVDAYVDAQLFEPLGIEAWRWAKDGAGNVQTFYGLALHARDMAKIGLLIANDGAYGESQIVSREWVRESTQNQNPGDGHGYLWWLRYRLGTLTVSEGRLAKLGAAGFGAVAKLEPLVGRSFPATAEREAFWLEAGARLDEPSRRALADLARGGVVAYDVERGGPFGIAADGWLGQQLIVVPSLGIVAVRQHGVPEGVVADDAYNQRVGYFKLARDLELALRAR